MATADQTLFIPDKRRCSRVPFRRNIKISAQGEVQKRCTTQNLSLGGMFIQGAVDLPLGHACRIELHETGRLASTIYRFGGKIAHKGKNGIGIEFTDMEDFSFTYIQTMVLYASDDPIEIAENFKEKFTASVDSSC
jgi:c-di-GMP-binding flagellar brake protein YcgR